MPDDPALRIFPDEFVPNIEGASNHAKWVAANKAGDAPKWRAFRDALLAGQSPTPPSMATKYGKALVAAGKEHMSISHFVGAMTPGVPPAPVPTPGEPPPPPPPPPPVTWEGPITISSGQTITGRNFESTTTAPAIVIATTQPVVIENCQVRMLTAGAHMINAYHQIPGPGTDITIRNCVITGRDDWDSPRWFVAQNWKNLLIQNNTIVNTRGIELWPNSWANPTTLITRNRHTNIKGTTTSGSLGLVGNFVQFRVVGQATALEVSWNEIINQYQRSNPEDLISIFKTAHTRIHDNMFWHHSKPTAFTGSSQNGITIDPSGEPALCFDNIIQNNQLVEGYSPASFGGNNNQLHGNRVVSDGRWSVVGGGTVPMAFGFEGIWVAPGFSGNHAHGNTIGYIGNSGRQDGRLNGTVEGNGDGISTGEWANNTHLNGFGGPITQADKDAEWTFWQNKLTTNDVEIGATAQPGFLDDFESINPATWQKKWWFNGDTYFHDNSALELQVWRDYNATVSGGVLNLIARREDVVDFQGRPHQFSSGIVQSNGIQGVTSAPGPSFTYGLFEARIKSAPGLGMWSTFWLCDAGWPSSCPTEIDIVEIVGADPNRAHMNFHVSGAGGGSSYLHGSPLSDDYHVYGLEWRPTYLAWFFDGVEKFRYTGAGIPSNPHYVILGLQIGASGSWAGTPNPATFTTSTQFVDWVRITP